MTADDPAVRRTFPATAAATGGAPTQRRLTLLSRAYCGLCDEMRDAATRATHAHGVALEDIDVDAFPALEAQWGELVPVLFLGAPDAGNELCHYHFDAARVEAALHASDPRAGGTGLTRDRGRVGS